MNFAISLFFNIYKIIIKENPVLTVLFTVIFILILYMYYSYYKIKNNCCIHHYIIKEQMRIAEEHLDEIENSMLVLYLKLSNELNINNACIDNIDTKRFVLFNSHLKNRTTNSIRTFFRENHLTIMTDKEFEAHIKERAKLIIRKLTSFFNEWYISDGLPTTTEFYGAFVKEELSKAANGIEHIFRKGRIVSHNFKNRKYKNEYFRTK